MDRSRSAVMAVFAVLAAWVVCLELQVVAIPGLQLGPVFGDYAHNVIEVLAGVLCLGGAWQARREQTAWLLIGIGVLAWALGNLYYTVVLYDMEAPPIPSPADAGFLLFPVLAMAGVLALVRARTRDVPTTLWTDGSIAALAVTALSAAIVFETALGAAEGQPLAVATTLAYPLTDLVLIGVAVGALASTGWRFDRTWVLLAIGIGTFWLADSFYLVQTAQGTYVAADVVRHRLERRAAARGARRVAAGGRAQAEHARRPALHLRAARVRGGRPGAADLRRAGPPQPGRRRARGAVPGRGHGAAGADVPRQRLDAAHLARRGADRRADRASATGARCRASWRPGCRTPTTATRSCSCSSTSTASSATTTPSATRPATRCSCGWARTWRSTCRAAAWRIRMGGDEFCALFEPGSEVADPIIAGAASALTEHGEGFTVTSSYGAIVLPREAQDATEALRIADQRMYAQKNAGRTSATRQSKDVLVRALTERAPERFAHLEGVAELAEQTARRLGLSDEEAEQVRHAAELHDIGKVAIPDAILMKPGPLDPREWEFIRRHTLIGERIVAAAPALVPVARLVRACHERWDGTGYPDKLAEQEIPVGARVVSVADAFDAMTSERPYSAAVTPASALEELRRNAGTQFDPVVVEAFCAVWAARTSSGSGLDEHRHRGATSHPGRGSRACGVRRAWKR